MEPIHYDPLPHCPNASVNHLTFPPEFSQRCYLEMTLCALFLQPFYDHHCGQRGKEKKKDEETGANNLSRGHGACGQERSVSLGGSGTYSHI